MYVCMYDIVCVCVRERDRLACMYVSKIMVCRRMFVPHIYDLRVCVYVCIAYTYAYTHVCVYTYIEESFSKIYFCFPSFTSHSSPSCVRIRMYIAYTYAYTHVCVYTYIEKNRSARYIFVFPPSCFLRDFARADSLKQRIKNAKSRKKPSPLQFFQGFRADLLLVKKRIKNKKAKKNLFI
jgi:hypothetical protein